HAQIAGGTYRDPVTPEKGPGLIAVQPGVVVLHAQPPCLKRYLIRMLENLEDSAASLDRTGYGQMAVKFHPEMTRQVQGVTLTERLLHLRDGAHRRLDDAGTDAGLGKYTGDIGCEACQAIAGPAHILKGKTNVFQRQSGGSNGRIEPGHFPQSHQLLNQRMILYPLRC